MVLRHGYSGLCELFNQFKSDVSDINVEGALRKADAYFFSIHDALRSQNDRAGLSGFKDFWAESTKDLTAFQGRAHYLTYLEAGSLFTEGKIEYGVKKLLPITAKDSRLFIAGQERILESYSILHDWVNVKNRALQMPEESKSREDYLNSLAIWDLGVSTTNLSTDLKNGSSNSLKNLILNQLAEVTNGGLECQNINEVQKLFSLHLFAEALLQVKKVLVYQSFFKLAGNFKLEEGIKLRKAKPKDKVTRDGLIDSDIHQWSDIYHISRLFEKLKKTRNPELDEIGGLLADLSRRTGNLSFARRLLDSSQSSLTESAKLRIRFKEARILQAEGQPTEACLLLLGGLSSNFPSLEIVDIEILAKSCSLIVVWNQLDYQDMSIQSKIEKALGKSVDKERLSKSSEYVAELFLTRATEIAPTLPKSWSMLSSFNYSVGRSQLEELLPGGKPCVFFDHLNKAASLFRNDELAISAFKADLLEQLGEGQKVEFDSADISWRHSLNQDTISELEVVQLEIKQKIFSQFEITSAAYFRFLKSLGGNSGRLAADEVTATLRLLRIFVRYGVALESVFVDSFLDTPIDPWKNVISQLFSRLMHPEPVVRKEISSLIVRIGEANPHLVIYSIFDDSSEHSQSTDLPSNESFEKIRDCMARSNPKLTSETFAWIKELQRITVVWEEFWVMGLDKLKVELNTRHLKLQKDAKRIKDNSSISTAEKEQILESTTSNLFRPVLYQFERLCQDTIFRSPETPHENEFIQKYGDLIAKAHQELISEISFGNITSLFSTCQLLLSDLKNYVSHRPTYSLESVSPYLAEFSCSGLQIPGVFDENVFVSHFSHQIQVLATKTRPKRITILSQDGRAFPFLLKGHEDLHLDSRIQQLLQVTNHLLTGGSKLNLYARTFAVIPFGRKFGMIQWLEDVTGIFGLYRKWQGWDHTAKSLQKRAVTPQPLRPNERFTAKIKNCMRLGRLPLSTPRKSFPQVVLLQVFKELENETPSNLITNELWASSISSTAFHAKTTAFSRSLAVMSIFGYILGLGDRHLDNILIDLSKGDVVHIDYNVCFEKGLKLAIPETVPFRLTQNFVHGCGVYGGFRVACEEVMGVLRKNKEHLLTLLETFVYDPLIDWKSDLSTTMIQINVEIGNFSSRILESRAVIQEVVEELKVYCETTLYECSKLSEIVDGGGFVKEMAALAVRDSTHSCEIMVQKLSRLVQDSRKLLNPLLKIIFTIIKLSSGTTFTNSSEFESLKSICSEWEATLGHAEEMQSNFKKFKSSLDFDSLQNLEKSLLLLSTSLKSIFSNLMLSTDLEPLSELFSDEEKMDVPGDEDGHQDKLRYNRGNL